MLVQQTFRLEITALLSLTTRAIGLRVRTYFDTYCEEIELRRIDVIIEVIRALTGITERILIAVNLLGIWHQWTIIRIVCHTITIRINQITGITSITQTITIRVQLIGVRHYLTVIQGVGNTVTIAIVVTFITQTV